MSSYGSGTGTNSAEKNKSTVLKKGIRRKVCNPKELTSFDVKKLKKVATDDHMRVKHVKICSQYFLKKYSLLKSTTNLVKSLVIARPITTDKSIELYSKTDIGIFQAFINGNYRV